MYSFFLKIDVEMFDFVIEYARCTYKNGASCFQVKSLVIKKRMYIVPVPCTQLLKMSDQSYIGRIKG